MRAKDERHELTPKTPKQSVSTKEIRKRRSLESGIASHLLQIEHNMNVGMGSENKRYLRDMIEEHAEYEEESPSDRSRGVLLERKDE